MYFKVELRLKISNSNLRGKYLIGTVVADSHSYDVSRVACRMDLYLEQSLASLLASARVSVGEFGLFKFLSITSSNLFHDQPGALLPSTSVL